MMQRFARWIQDASVVFVINHRSNMDYVLVTYVAAASSALSYAVGEWAQVWPLRALIRSMGAYFIRRNSRDALYRKILARYVHTATQAGVVQAVFPEGGLSLDGALREPKLGLISYMVSGFDPQGERDVVFIPVGVNYDRVLEDQAADRGRCARQGGGTPLVPRQRAKDPRLRRQWRLAGDARALASLWLCLCELRQADLAQGPSGGAACRSAHADAGAPGGRNRGIGQGPDAGIGADRASPAGIARRARLARMSGRALTAFELKGEVHELMARLESRGAYIHIPRRDREYAVEVGVRTLLQRHIILEQDGQYRVNPDEMALLAYYANAIAHLDRADAPPAAVAVPAEIAYFSRRRMSAVALIRRDRTPQAPARTR